MKWTTPVKVSLIGLTAFLLYFPIVIIAVFAFNDSARTISWSGFTLRWVGEIFNDRSLFESIQRTWLIAIISTLIATVVGTFVAIGIHDLTAAKRRRILF